MWAEEYRLFRAEYKYLSSSIFHVLLSLLFSLNNKPDPMENPNCKNCSLQHSLFQAISPSRCSDDLSHGRVWEAKRLSIFMN